MTLSTNPDPVNPTLTVTAGQFMRPIALDPQSRIVVGWEDRGAAVHTNHQRQASFVVSELASVTLDLDRIGSVVLAT